MADDFLKGMISWFPIGWSRNDCKTVMIALRYSWVNGSYGGWCLVVMMMVLSRCCSDAEWESRMESLFLNPTAPGISLVIIWKVAASSALQFLLQTHSIVYSFSIAITSLAMKMKSVSSNRQNRKEERRGEDSRFNYQVHTALVRMAFCPRDWVIQARMLSMRVARMPFLDYKIGCNKLSRNDSVRLMKKASLSRCRRSGRFWMISISWSWQKVVVMSVECSAWMCLSFLEWVLFVCVSSLSFLLMYKWLDLNSDLKRESLSLLTLSLLNQLHPWIHANMTPASQWEWHGIIMKEGITETTLSLQFLSSSMHT